MTHLAEVSWAAVPVFPLVLLPLGSTEQHGPHLPFATDTIIAEAVAAGIAQAAVEDVMIVPAVSIGSSGEHQAFAGTVSMGTAALHLMLVEIVRSLSTWAGQIVVVNAHGGNVPALREAVPQLRDEGHHVAWLPCASPGADPHAGRTETSLLLHLRRDQVDLDAAVVGETAPLSEILGRLARDGVRVVSPSGILGDPTGANAGEGERLLAAMIGMALRRVAAGEVDATGCLRDPEEP